MKLLLSFIALMLTACGGGGGSDGGNNPGQTQQDFFAKGIYFGDVTDIENEDTSMIAIVGKDGNFLALNIDYETVINGKLSGNSPTAQGSATGYTSAFYTFLENGLSTIALSVSFTQGSDKAITGTTKYQGVTNSNFSLAFESDIYNNPPANFSSVAGTYTGTANEVDVYFSIDAQGKVTGFDDAGCEYSGSLTQEESGKNIYISTVSVTKCGNANGNYPSKATFLLDPDNDPIFIVIGNNSKYAAGGVFFKTLDN